MTNRHEVIARFCFASLLVVGLGLLLIGLVIEPMTPYIALDCVLTPTELADPIKRESMMAVLEKAEGNRWLLWALAGIIVIALSGVGLWTTRRKNRSTGDT